MRTQHGSHPFRLALEHLEDRCLPSGLITGVVYQDFNSNGVRDLNVTIPTVSGSGSVGVANDRGIGGVFVIATDAAGNVQGAATTAADGSYALSAAGSGPYRIQFVALPAGFFPGPHGPQNGTTVQFAPDGNSTDIDLGLVRPADFSQDNPPLVTQIYQFGDQINGPNANQPVLVSFPYNSGASDATLTEAPYLQPTTHALAVTANQIGTTWGLAFNRLTQTIYAAAFAKKFAGYGPDGPGAIYQMGTTGTTATLFADLNQIFPGATGPNFRAGYTSPDDFLTDSFNTGWDAVGKTALGGMAVSDDGSTLYVMNLFDRNLYILPTSGPLNSTTVRRVAVPNPITLANSNDPNLDFRPFAVEFHDGKVYVGAVNSAESTQDPNNLTAYVLVFDPTTDTFNSTPVLQFALNYPRGRTDFFPGTPGTSANWLPWSPGFNNIDTSTGGVLNTIYPQPMLTGLAFDANNNLVLGFRDRAGDQTGVFTPDDPSQPTVLRRGITAGDTLRAAFNPATGIFTLENNGSVGGNTSAGAGNGQGPGGGEFYFQDSQPLSNTNRDGPGNHDEVTVGGVAQIPGFPDVAVTAFNPIRLANLFNRGGIRLFNNTTGTTDTAYQLFETPAPPVLGQGFTTFAKANGVGDLIALSDPAPVEIGNRVWFDLNRNGIQDANEPGIAGVTVHLYGPGDVLLATSITDANGDYYFSNGPGTSTASAIYNIDGLTFNTAGLSIRLDNPADYALGGPLHALAATVAHVGTDPAVDSNGIAFSATDVRAAVSVGGPGQNDHTFDFGFAVPLPPSPPPPPPPPPPSTADVSLTKEVNQTNPIFGTPAMYTLIVHNNGPDAATGVTMTDVLPAGVLFLTATPSQGSFDVSSGRWTIGTLANGATATLQITGLVATIGPITNAASAATSTTDPDLANNVSSVTIDGMFAAGQISKRLLLSSNDPSSNAAVLAAEEALFNALMPMWVNVWDALLSVAQSLLAARNDPGPGNDGIPVFEGNWFGSPLVVYANPFAGQVTAVQIGTFDFLHENNEVAGVRLL